MALICRAKSMVWACSALLLVSVSSTRAQDADKAPAGYNQAVNQGLSELEAGNYPEAREEFRRAHALSPSARTLRSLGMVEFELRNYRASVTYLEQALESPAKPLTGRLRSETEELLHRAERYLGTLVVKRTPRDASVIVDGVREELGPANDVRLEVGKHTVEVRQTGYLPSRDAVEIRGGETSSLAVSLDAISARDKEPAPLGSSPARSVQKDEPLRKKWWIWTTVALVVVGGGVVAAVMLTRDDEPGKNAVMGTNTVPGVQLQTLSQF